MQRVRGKLGNENFLRNAPPDVVVKEQAKLKARLARKGEGRQCTCPSCRYILLTGKET